MDRKSQPHRYTKRTNPKAAPSTDPHGVGNIALFSATSDLQYKRIDDEVLEEGGSIKTKPSSSRKHMDRNRSTTDGAPSKVSTSNDIENVMDLIKQQVRECNKQGKALISKDTKGDESSRPKSPQAPREQFTAFGIKAYPTQAKKDEICHDFIFKTAWCEYGNRCLRIHPLDKAYYLSVLRKSLNSNRNNQIEPKEDALESVVLITTKTDPEILQNPVPEVKLPSSRIVQNYELVWQHIPDTSVWTDSSSSSSSEPSWDTSGVWQTFPDAKAWTDSSSSSDESYQESSMFSSATVSSCSSVAGDSESSYKTVTRSNAGLRERRVCFNWLRGKCFRTPCNYAHEVGNRNDDDNVSQNNSHASHSRALSYTESMGPRQFSQKRKGVCRDWLQGNCSRGYFCLYVHEGKGGHNDNLILPTFESKASGSSPEQVVVNPPRPKHKEICWLWLRDQCSRGSSCNYVHEDIEYDDNIKVSQPPNETRSERPMSHASPSYVQRKPPEALFITVHDHIKIQLGPGFEVQQVVTGFESTWLFLSNVPLRVSQEDVVNLLRPYGTVTDIRAAPSTIRSTATFKVRMSSAVEASQVCAALNGSKAFGATVAARLSVTNSGSGNALLCDTSVRITWDVPGKIAYAGYPTKERAQEAIQETRIPLGETFIKAGIYSGLPAVGVVTVRFRGVPAEADEEDMRRFARPEDIVWERRNYSSLVAAVEGIKRYLYINGTGPVGFELKPPPYKDAQVLAFAHFATPSDAEAVCKNLDGRKPACIGLTRVTARHIKSISYTLNGITYRKLSQDIENLQRSIWRQYNDTTLTVIPPQSTASVTVRLCSEDLQKLGRLKMEMESILTGEVVKQDGKIAWDGFFGRPAGLSFLQELERKYSGMNIERNAARRMIRLFGPLFQRRTVRNAILRKVEHLSSQRTHIVRLEGRLIGFFMSADLMKLQKKLGPENVFLDLYNRCLRIRGDEEAYAEAQEIVDSARQSHPQERPNRQGPMCPVCLDTAAFPISLQCGHTWCRSCLKNYLEAAHSQKHFPLTCLGNEARCSMLIPLSIAREILPIADFEALAHTAFSAHVHSHPHEFHFCPTPNCPQVYRASVANGAPIQCPSCLIRICSHCHAEAHEGLACIEADYDDQFKEWAKTHDVKNCPGCNIPIEREEGCNHVTCTRCQTHTCWACMATFPRGDGIYGHMRIAHGTFGLGPIE